MAMDLDRIANRSYERVKQQVPDDSPLKRDDGSLLCPWCRRPMRVRFSSLGRISTVEDTPVFVDGVRMKCAGSDGCGYRPDFDVPISEKTYEMEMEEREHTTVDFGSSTDGEEERRKRLEDLGYIV